MQMPLMCCSLQAAHQPAHSSNNSKEDMVVPSTAQACPHLHADVVESFAVNQRVQV